jgi:hypothetical protein
MQHSAHIEPGRDGLWGTLVLEASSPPLDKLLILLAVRGAGGGRSLQRTILRERFPVPPGKYREFPQDRAFRGQSGPCNSLQCLNLLIKFPKRRNSEFFERNRES